VGDGFESGGGGTASYPGEVPVFGRGRAAPRPLQKLVFLAASLSLLFAAPMALAAFVVHSGTDFDVCVGPTGGVGATPLVAIRITVIGKGGARPAALTAPRAAFPVPARFPASQPSAIGCTRCGNSPVWS